MESLNDIVEMHVNVKKGIFEHMNIKAELDLGSDMPEIYEDFTYGTPLHRALSQLSMEAEDAKSSKVLYKTQYNNRIQRLTISHNGNSLSEGNLSHLNAVLREIAEGHLVWDTDRHGNLIAGQAIKEYSGRIWLENINENGYNVRTIMEIPVKNL